MTRRSAGVAAMAALVALMGFSALGVGAATATTITITVQFSPPQETFVTTGGVLCPDGTATSDSRAAGRGAGISFHVVKTLTCTDGSGTFVMQVSVGTHAGSPQDQGGWRIVSGTGDYATLRGGGSIVGTGVVNGVIDLYTGYVTD